MLGELDSFILLQRALFSIGGSLSLAFQIPYGRLRDRLSRDIAKNIALPEPA
jgi:hypothetical protein